ncbi:IS701 family transposase [Microvirga calopogonii]|uniref:IS701 family transposase n=1 Tax=Microvirga calopogonii TaxID=2078013 RepID=UPI001FDFCD75|nr:transposase [Microvirga calopogonii]
MASAASATSSIIGVLNRARWSRRRAAHLLLGLLIDTFVPAGPVILGLDDTIERRRGKRIAAKGIYRDPVRSSNAHFVKASGLRWISLMLLAPIPWAARIWALPFLTALAPSERSCHERGQRHKKLTDWARQMLLQVRRWRPERELVLVADMGFAALELLAALSRRGVICITRLRLDAALYEPAPRRRLGTKGRPRSKGARLPALSEVLIRTSTRWRRVTVPGWYGEGDRVIEFCSATAVWCHSGKPVVPIRWVLLRDPLGRFSPQALLGTDPKRDPLQVIRWFILRWQLDVTFQEARAHLGVETQRQWSDSAVARSTPCLFGLFSMVTLLAGQLHHQTRTAVWTDSWYRKSRPTFAGALAAVRRQIWREVGLLTSRCRHNAPKPSPALQRCLVYALCHAA